MGSSTLFIGPVVPDQRLGHPISHGLAVVGIDDPLLVAAVVDVPQFNVNRHGPGVGHHIEVAVRHRAVVAPVGLVLPVFLLKSVLHEPGGFLPGFAPLVVVKENVDVFVGAPGVDMDRDHPLKLPLVLYGKPVYRIGTLLQPCHLVKGDREIGITNFILVGFKVVVVPDAIVGITGDEINRGTLLQEVSPKPEDDIVGIFIFTQRIPRPFPHGTWIRSPVSRLQKKYRSLQVAAPESDLFVLRTKNGIASGGCSRLGLAGLHDQKKQQQEQSGDFLSHLIAKVEQIVNL